MERIFFTFSPPLFGILGYIGTLTMAHTLDVYTMPVVAGSAWFWAYASGYVAGKRLAPFND